MPKIYVLWGTIRPYVFVSSLKVWHERSNGVEFTTHVCINDFFSKEEKEIVNKAVGNNGKVVEINQTRFGICQKAYELSSKLECDNDNDIIVFASDDFFPCENWTNFLLKKLEEREGVFLVNDGYQALDFSNMAEPIFSIPIMTFGALKKLNKVIYNPVYFHLCSDAELYLNAKELGLIIDEREIGKNIFEPHHWSNGKRQPDINDQKHYSYFEQDKRTWENRKKLTLEERLIN